MTIWKGASAASSPKNFAIMVTLLEDQRMIAKLLLQNLIWIVVMGALLFVPAGTLHWPAAWVFLGTIAVLGIAGGLWLAKTDPALLDQRMRSRACRAMLITRRGGAIVCCRGFGGAFTVGGA